VLVFASPAMLAAAIIWFLIEDHVLRLRREFNLIHGPLRRRGFDVIVGPAPTPRPTLVRTLPPPKRRGA